MPPSANCPLSSLRTQGPIITGLEEVKRFLIHCPSETPQRMGPCVRRDDSLKRNDENPRKFRENDMSDRLKGKRAFVTARRAGIGRASRHRLCARGSHRHLPPTSMKRACALARQGRVSPRWRGSTCATPRPSPLWPSASARSTSCSTRRVSCITAPCSTAPTKTGISRSTSTSSRCTGPSGLSAGHAAKRRRLDREHLVLPPACSRPPPNRYVYGATKAAVAALTRAVAARLHHQGHPLQLHLPRHHRDAVDAATAPPQPVPDGREISSAASRWDGSAPPRKSPRWPSISPATKAAFTTGVAHIIDGGWTLF